MPGGAGVRFGDREIFVPCACTQPTRHRSPGVGQQRNRDPSRRPTDTDPGTLEAADSKPLCNRRPERDGFETQHGVEVYPKNRSEYPDAVFWLSDPRAVLAHPKAGRLARLRAAGLPVPDGIVLERSEWNLDSSGRHAIGALLAKGPVIVRSILPDEDAAGGSAAGLGLSVADCCEVAQVEAALHRLAAAEGDPALATYRQPRGRPPLGLPQALVQHQIPRATLLVLAVFDDGTAYAEAHGRGVDVLAAGVTPQWAGPLEDWPDPARQAVCTVGKDLRGQLDARAHGLDAEVVVDPQGQVHLVQARPVAAALHRGWDAFLAEVEAREEGHLMGGSQLLDVEHNPRPISAAHASLLDWLRAQRPGVGDPTSLAGWLYVRELPQNLRRATASPPPPATGVIRRLHEEWLPAARALYRDLRDELPGASPHDLPRLLDRAQVAFLSMIDVYVCELVPARTHARATAGTRANPDTPFSLVDRERFLDVLPVEWDVASPTLAESMDTPALPPATDLPDEEAAAATLLGEWDDHLFALGLAPLRAVYLRAGQRRGIGHEVFHLRLEELATAMDWAADQLQAVVKRRAAAHARAGLLWPPLRLLRGHPLPPPPGRPLHGIPIGPVMEGTVEVHADLTDLLSRGAVSPETIVVLPALTSQAAVALFARGVRAVCCEHGGALSHAALTARELRLSAIIGCRGCTQLRSGTRARVDTRTGRLVVRPGGQPPLSGGDGI